MLQPQIDVEAAPKSIAVEFNYEPIFWLRSLSVLAYEQLARKPEGADASFLNDFSNSQRERLDLASLNTAFQATEVLSCPVFVNAFPLTLERMAKRLAITDNRLQQSVGLEVNEGVPIDELVEVASAYPDIWWVIDDLDLRPDALDTVANPYLRSLPLTVKFHAHSPINHSSHLFDMSLLPSNWSVIVEGVKPDMLSTLKKRGVNFMQGRDLGFKQPNITGTQVFI